jgi:hypothetical protein
MCTSDRLCACLRKPEVLDLSLLDQVAHRITTFDAFALGTDGYSTTVQVSPAL